MTRRAGLVTLLLAVCFGLGTAVFAISVRTVNLGEMVGASGRIFYGRCLAAVDLKDLGVGVPVRLYRFEVLDGLKNAVEGEVVEFRQVRGQGPGARIPGVPEYRKGQELLLFLYPDSRLGLTSPVGLQQGIFRTERLRSGEIGFVNGYGNRNLAQDLTQQMASDSGLTTREVEELRSGDPVPLDRLRAIVEKLDENADRFRREVQ